MDETAAYFRNWHLGDELCPPARIWLGHVLTRGELPERNVALDQYQKQAVSADFFPNRAGVDGGKETCHIGFTSKYS